MYIPTLYTGNKVGIIQVGSKEGKPMFFYFSDFNPVYRFNTRQVPMWTRLQQSQRQDLNWLEGGERRLFVCSGCKQRGIKKRDLCHCVLSINWKTYSRNLNSLGLDSASGTVECSLWLWISDAINEPWAVVFQPLEPWSLWPVFCCCPWYWHNSARSLRSPCWSRRVRLGTSWHLQQSWW